MGFLLGAFGKLAAGSRLRSLQARAMRIQSKIRRAARDTERMEKYITNCQKAGEQNIRSLEAKFKSDALNEALTQGYGNILKYDGNNLDFKDTATSQAYMKVQADVTANVTNYVNAMKAQLEDQIEWMRESQLQPLKDYEDELQTENDSIKSQIEIAKMDYEACKEMEKADAQMLKPSYTAGG